MANDLYIRWKADVKASPRPGANEVYWESPSLRIVKLDPANGWAELPHDPAVAVADAADQYIAVKVESLATTPKPIVVQAWIRGFGTSGDWLTGVAGLAEVADIRNGNPLTASSTAPALAYLRWSPTTAQLNGFAERHGCILANCFSPNPADPDGSELATGTAVTPVPNQHHAQRNITLVKISSLAPELHFPIEIGNPFKGSREELFTIEVRRRERLVLDRGQLLSLIEHPDLTKFKLRDPRLGGEDRLAKPGRPFQLGKGRPDFDIGSGGDRGRKLEVPLKPKKFKEIDLGVGFGKKPNPGLYRFEIIQRGRGQTISGATVLVMVERG